HSANSRSRASNRPNQSSKSGEPAAWSSSNRNNPGATPQRLHGARACKKAGRARSVQARPVIAKPAPGRRGSRANHESRAGRARLLARETALDPDRSIRSDDIRGINDAQDAVDSLAARVRLAG